MLYGEYETNKRPEHDSLTLRECFDFVLAVVFAVFVWLVFF